MSLVQKLRKLQKPKEIKLRLRSLEATTLARQSNANQKDDNMKNIIEKMCFTLKSKTGANFWFDKPQNFNCSHAPRI